MKKLLLNFVFLGSWAIIAHAQGTVNFANIAGGGGVLNPNAPVYESDGVTLLSGPRYMAELLGGPFATSLASVATTTFLTGASAGYFLAGTQTIDSVAPGATAWVQVDVWNTASGTTFNQALASGLLNSWWQSPVFSVMTGKESVNPSAPGNLTGLGNSPVYLNGVVPEPSTLALAALGAAVLLLHFRRCRNV